jgi:aldehyde:ferredoxin oxidoreductase
MNGYTGKLLIVDLGSGQFRTEPISAAEQEKFIGGMGMNLKLMQKYGRRRVGALDPENIVVVGTGPMVGTIVPSASKVFMTTKQPLNDCIGTGAAGMNFGAMLKRAGFDHVVIDGRSERPVVLVITDSKIELRPAEDLWGKDIATATHALLQSLGGADGSVYAIGPAGERGVTFSRGLVDNVASLGKGGLASVLGSKNLKAIVASGAQEIGVADGPKLMETVSPILAAMRTSPKRKNLMKYASMQGWEHWAEVAGIPYKDWTEVHPRAPLREVFGPEAYLDVEKKLFTCISCSLPCKEAFTYDDDNNVRAMTFASSYIGRVTAFGARCGVSSIREMFICHDLCNRLGLDTYSTGSAIDYAMKLYEDGLLTQSDAGFPLDRNFATAERLIRAIALREGIGDLLAQGFSKYEQNFGRRFDAQIKGADFIFDARSYGMGTYEFEEIVNPRGAHQHAGGSPTYGSKDFPVSGLRDFCRTVGVPQESVDAIFADPTTFNVARLTKHCEDWYTAFSLSGICSRKNIKAFYNMDLLAKILTHVTGYPVDSLALKLASDRAWNLLKSLNAAEGFGRADDAAPHSWFKPLKDGEKKLGLKDYYGKRTIGQEELENLLDDYYDEHGWCTQHGVPTGEKMTQLGLDEEWRDLAVHFGKPRDGAVASCGCVVESGSDVGGGGRAARCTCSAVASLTGAYEK